VKPCIQIDELNNKTCLKIDEYHSTCETKGKHMDVHHHLSNESYHDAPKFIYVGASFENENRSCIFR
jgi:hypothetical protein